MRFEHLVEVRRVTSRFPTGEVRTSEAVGMRWVSGDEHRAGGEGTDVLFCAPPSDTPGTWIRRAAS